MLERFKPREEDQVRITEPSLICTGHNLLKLFRFGAAQPRETTVRSGHIREDGRFA